ncbi:MAG: helix-turn-helix transcriptional regulator [Bacillota bacterium]
MSQEQLAGLAGVTRQTISAVENNQYVPSAQLAFVLALCLNKPVAEVFYLEEVHGNVTQRPVLVDERTRHGSPSEPAHSLVRT